MTDANRATETDEDESLLSLKAYLRANKSLLRDDLALLTDLGLRLDAANGVGTVKTLTLDSSRLLVQGGGSVNFNFLGWANLCRAYTRMQLITTVATPIASE